MEQIDFLAGIFFGIVISFAVFSFWKVKKIKQGKLKED